MYSIWTGSKYSGECLGVNSFFKNMKKKLLLNILLIIIRADEYQPADDFRLKSKKKLSSKNYTKLNVLHQLETPSVRSVNILIFVLV